VILVTFCHRLLPGFVLFHIKSPVKIFRVGGKEKPSHHDPSKYAIGSTIVLVLLIAIIIITALWELKIIIINEFVLRQYAD